MSKISIERINNKNIDYNLIYSWCSKEFVYEWFEQRILSLDEIINKYKNKLLNHSQELFYIKYSQKRIGLIQIYESKYKNKSVNEFDLYIGEEDYLNKKIGQELISIIMNYIDKNYKNTTTILRPFKRNIRACKCYQNSGFKWLEDYNGFDTLNNPEIISVFTKNKIIRSDGNEGKK